MATIGVGYHPKRLNDHSVMWKLTLNNNNKTKTQDFESSDLHSIEKACWGVALHYDEYRASECVMYCFVLAEWGQKEISRYVQLLYRLSIVDESSEVMWSKTVLGSFVMHRCVRCQGRLLPVPSSIINAVNNRLKASEECFVKLDFITRGVKKDEENDSETVPGTALFYQDTDALSEAVKELLLDDDYCDVTLSVQGREFKAHRSIFSVRSPVFKKMFAHDMLEKKSGRVEIEDCDPDVFALFLRFLYTGKADGWTEKNVAPLYHLGDKYCVPSLCKICELFIKNNFDVEEFGDLAEIACLNKEAEEDLFKLAVAFMGENFREIAKTIKWKQFMRKNPEGANELFQVFYGEINKR